MHRTKRPSFRALALALCLATSASVGAVEYGTAFTYQGSLKASGVALDGTADFEFSLYNQAAGGVPLTAPLVLNNVQVSDGVFTVLLDFGTLPQSSEEHFLQIVVNSTILSPRQKFAPAPLAQKALRVPLVFGGQIHESPYWSTDGLGSFANPNGITEALYSESRAQMIMPTDCTAKNLFVRNMSTSGYDNTTVTLRVNGVGTQLSCAQTFGLGMSCSNTVDSVDVLAGDLVSLQFLPNLPARPITNAEDETRAFVSFSLMCE